MASVVCAVYLIYTQFYTNPGKLAVVGRKPQEVEEINRKALRIAREVATRTNTLMCGDLSLTNQYSPKAEDQEAVRLVFKVCVHLRERAKPETVGTSAMGGRGGRRLHRR